MLPNGGAGFIIDGGNVDRMIAAFTFYREVKLAGNKLTLVASTRALAQGIAFAAVAADRALTLDAKKYAASHEIAYCFRADAICYYRFISAGSLIMRAG